MFKRKTFIATIAASAVCALSFGQVASAQLLGLIGSNPNNLSVIGLTTDQRLITFRTANPSFTTRNIGLITGLITDTALVGIDFRPLVGPSVLYGVGNAGGVYTLNTTTSRATLVNRLSVPLEGTAFGVDFNPAADRLRIISNTGQNLRHNVNAGGVTLVDGPLNNGATVPVTTLGVTAAAYTNNDGLEVTVTGTTLYVINTSTDAVALQAPPNAGTLSTTGPLNVRDSGSPDVVGDVGFDIYSVIDGNGTIVDNRGFAALNTNGETGTGIYSIEVTSGHATPLGPVRSGNNLMDIALPFNQ